MKKEFYLSCLLLMAVACSSDDVDNVPQTRVDIELTESEKVISAQQTDFAFRFFDAAYTHLEEKQRSNLLLSPLSASYAFSMLTNGANGQTRDALMEVLGFEGCQLDDVNGLQQKLTNSLKKVDNTSKVGIANALWIGNGFNPLNSFQKTLERYYDAEVERVDFGNAATLKRINQWCSDKTYGCIPDFLKQLDPDTKMLLTNALYFKGLWTTPFDKKQTEEFDFTQWDGSKVQTDYMHRKGSFMYAEADCFRLLDIPYGNRAFSMVVLLPDEGVTPQQCVQALDGERWNRLVKQLSYQDVDLRLPKFTVRKSYDLTKTVKAMGLNHLFMQPDFSLLSDDPLFISLIQQDVYILVDEEGTEAAAVTGIGDLTAAPPMAQDCINFHVTRPFLYVLKEISTGTILFIGQTDQL